MSSLAKANQSVLESGDISFFAGYLSASAYDIGTYSHASNRSINMHHVGWKLGLGLLAGLGVAIGRSGGVEPFHFRDFVMGGLGGVTCVVIHF
jgi:hypothetical protein